MPDSLSHEAPAHEVLSLPVTIPPKLIGRDALLGKVYTRLRENAPIQIYGAPGVGKTALAARLAAAYTEQPGGVLWLNVENSTIEELMVRVGRAYNVPEITNTDNPLGMIGAVASTLTQHKPLIILDGRLEENVVTAFVARCAVGLPIMIVTAKPVSETWTAIEVPALDANHAALLFKQTAGVPESPDPDIDQLVKLLKFSPFAIVVAATNVRTSKQAPIQYVNALTQIPGYTNADPTLLALTAAFRALNSALQGLILMMGATFKRQASTELLSAVGNAPQDTIQQVMNLLSQQYLVEKIQRYGAPYYRLHEITYSFAQSWLRGSQRLDGLQAKMRDAVLAYAKKYSSGDSASHDKLAAEAETFVAVAEWAEAQNDRDTANQLILTLTQAGDFINQRGYLYELLRLRRLAITSTTAFPYAGNESVGVSVIDEDEDEELPLRSAAAPNYIRDMFEDVNDDGLAYDEDEDDIEDYDENDVDDEDVDDEDFEDEDDAEEVGTIRRATPSAIDEAIAEIEAALPPAPAADSIAGLRAAIILARQQSNLRRQSELLRTLGTKQIEQKMENEAIATYGEAIPIFEELGDDEGLLEILDTLSALTVKTENSQAAVLHAMQGIKLAEKLRDDDTRMQLLITLGDARQQLGESENAERSFRQALEIARKTGDRQNEALILYKLGYAQIDNGDPEEASSTWEQALSLFREQSKRSYEGRVMGGLGTAYGELDRWAEAISFHTSALHIAREVSDREEEALQLSNLGYASVRAEQLGQAVLRYRQALHLAYQSEDRENIVSTIVDLVRLLVKSPRHLSIAQLLINDAAQLEPADRDVKALKDKITSELLVEEAQGVKQAAVTGTTQEYAANAYKLLES
jgi:tetratricopeptide (TPR) repeat protein/energy-coupling factor transporter ATP-binding protein EcfA2